MYLFTTCGLTRRVTFFNSDKRHHQLEQSRSLLADDWIGLKGLTDHLQPEQWGNITQLVPSALSRVRTSIKVEGEVLTSHKLRGYLYVNFPV